MAMSTLKVADIVFVEDMALVPELKALLLVCEPDKKPSRELVKKFSGIAGVKDNPQIYTRAGHSSIHFFSLDGRSSDTLNNRPIVRQFEQLIADENATCAITGTPVVLVESQDLLNKDLTRALPAL